MQSSGCRIMRQRILACASVFFLACSYLPAIGQAQLNFPAAAQPSAPAQPNPPAAAAAPAPKIDTAEIVRRANQSVGIDIEAKLKDWRSALDRIEEHLRQPRLTYQELNIYRDQLLALRADAEAFWQKLEGPLRAMDDQVQKLPPAPAQGQPPEPEQAAQLRAELNYHLGVLTSARTSLDATHARIDQLLNAIQDIRRKNFTNNLFQPVPGVFSAQTWETVPAYAKFALDRARTMIEGWWQGVHDREGILRLCGITIALWLALKVFSWRSIRRLRRWPGMEPPFWLRASSAASVIVLKVLPTVAALVLFYDGLIATEKLPDNLGWLLYAAARSIIILVVINALIRTVLSPAKHQWRLIPASDRAASSISALVFFLALVYSLTTFVYAATRIVQAPFSLTLALTLPANLLIALLAAAILKTPLRDGHVEGMPSLGWLKALRLPIWLAVAAIILAALSGYLALSRFIAQQLVVTGSILALVYLLLLWADGAGQAMTDEASAAGAWLKRVANLDESRRGQLAVPITLFLKLVVLLAAVPLILLQWAYPWSDIIELYRQLFFGFHIGNTQVSLGAILASIIVFILGYFAAKLFQQWLDVQVLKPAGLSGGLRDSIRTGVGYIGVFAAALIALSYAGFNLSNLALVAGAFSVGIGFGLQSVVSNFVSGLILLAERPIKIGDLVVVGGEEGIVRKISVRSTEIETPDRANVLVPNSFFITEKVKNWTLRNNTGRVTIPVGVAYGCDPRKVKAILLKVAQEHPNVMSSPEPQVDFEEFGPDTLNFKLYAFVYD